MVTIILIPSLDTFMIMFKVSNSTPTPYNFAHINYLIKNESRETHIFRFAPTASRHRKHHETTLSLCFRTVTTERCYISLLR